MLSIFIFLCFGFFLSIRANECQYNTTDGLIDLRVFGKKSGPKYINIPDTVSTENRVYSFNGCFSYSTGGDCKDAAACITDTQTKVSKRIVRQDGTQVFVYSTGLTQITYGDDSGNQLLLILTCQTAPSARGHQSGANNYVLYIEDECACPGKCTYHDDGGSGGIGGGAIFVIILISIVGAYLIFGAVFLRLVKNQQGLDMIPHRSMWSQLGKDCVGGARFVVQKVRGKSSDYQSV